MVRPLPVARTTRPIHWPGGRVSRGVVGSGWLELAQEAGMDIPIGCGKGSCGACEIEVNGEILRACITNLEAGSDEPLRVEGVTDPFW